MVLCGFALWHLLRTPFLLHGETVEKMHRESAEAVEVARKSAQAQAVASSRVIPADWRELSDKFAACRQVHAQFQKSRQSTTWHLYDEQCRAMCSLAGTMLIASTKVAASLSADIRNCADPVSRWLEYVKETTTSHRTEYVIEMLPDGEEIIHFLGSIDNVPQESVSVCIHCCAKELGGS
jgi:hypothetical protein